jgi:Type II secretion system (T2SS), protein M subtype b
MTVQARHGASGGRAGGSAARLWAQLGTNRRAAAGLIVIMVLLAIYGLFVMSDHISATRGDYRQQIAQTRRSLAISANKQWPARARESARLRDALERQMWRFESEGVALANLQDWITAAAREAGLTKTQVRIDVARPKDLGTGVVQFSATIAASQTGEALQKFLAKIERDPHVFAVQELHVQIRPAVLTMNLVTYAIIRGPSGAAAK